MLIFGDGDRDGGGPRLKAGESSAESRVTLTSVEVGLPGLAGATCNAGGTGLAAPVGSDIDFEVDVSSAGSKRSGLETAQVFRANPGRDLWVRCKTGSGVASTSVPPGRAAGPSSEWVAGAVAAVEFSKWCAVRSRHRSSSGKPV